MSILEQERGLCFRCHHFEQVEIPETWITTYGGYRKKEQGYYADRCNFLDRYIQKIRQDCRHFLDRRNTKLAIGGDGMVKLNDIPAEEERIDLKDLPREAELIAVEERVQEATEGKSGGLIIIFKMRDNRTFPQKYTVVSGAVLGRALKSLKVKDTTELQKAWYKYELTAMRIGLPRMIPVKKVE